QLALLTETVARERQRNEAAEHQVRVSDKRRADLEVELSTVNRSQTRLEQDLEASRKKLDAVTEFSATEQSRLEARIRELQSAKADVEEQLSRLTERLGQETKQRESAEQQAAQLGEQRRQLEAQVGQVVQQLTQARRDTEVERANRIV